MIEAGAGGHVVNIASMAGYWLKRLFPGLVAALGRYSARQQEKGGRGLF